MVKDANAASDGHEKSGSWADCVSGTLTPEAYLEMLKQAGFKTPEFVETTGYKTADTTIGALFRAVKP